MAGFSSWVSAVSHVAFTDRVKDNRYLLATFIFYARNMHACVVTIPDPLVTCFLHITHAR